MDFSYPPEAEQFRKALSAWPSAHLTKEVIDSGANRGTDEGDFETLRMWNAAVADAGWAAVSWSQEYGAIQVFGGIGFTWEHDAHLYLKRLLSFSRFLGGPGDDLEQLGMQLTRSTA